MFQMYCLFSNSHSYNSFPVRPRRSSPLFRALQLKKLFRSLSYIRNEATAVLLQLHSLTTFINAYHKKRCTKRCACSVRDSLYLFSFLALGVQTMRARRSLLLTSLDDDDRSAATRSHCTHTCNIDFFCILPHGTTCTRPSISLLIFFIYLCNLPSRRRQDSRVFSRTVCEKE